MHTMKKIIPVAILALTLFSFLSTPTVSAQTLPTCLKNMNAVKSSDPNKYSVKMSDGRTLILYLSNNRYFGENNAAENGTWKCNAANTGITLTPSVRTGTTTGDNSGIPKPGNDTEQVSTPCVGAACDSSGSSQPTDFTLLVKLKNPLKVNTIQGAIQLFMNTVVKIAIPFIVVFFVYAGFRFILARGNPTELQTAKKMFWYTVIGALLIFGAWAITNAIVGTINSISS